MNTPSFLPLGSFTSQILTYGVKSSATAVPISQFYIFSKSYFILCLSLAAALCSFLILFYSSLSLYYLSSSFFFSSFLFYSLYKASLCALEAYLTEKFNIDSTLSTYSLFQVKSKRTQPYSQGMKWVSREYSQGLLKIPYSTRDQSASLLKNPIKSFTIYLATNFL